jgi:periplasmic protein TonB
MPRLFRSAVIPALVVACASLLSAADLRVSTTDALKAAVQKAVPDYPPLAKQLRIEGHVAIEVTIDTDGSVSSAKVLTGNAMLQPAALNAVKKWRFSPFKQDGAPAKALTVLDFAFKL